MERETRKGVTVFSHLDQTNLGKRGFAVDRKVGMPIHEKLTTRLRLRSEAQRSDHLRPIYVLYNFCFSAINSLCFA